LASTHRITDFAALAGRSPSYLLSNPTSFACDGGEPYVAAVAALQRFSGIVPAHNSYGSYLSVDGQCYVDILEDLGMLHGRS
jgi:hypothetical protein